MALNKEDGSTVTVSAYAIDSSTGALTAVGSPVSVPTPTTVTVKPVVDSTGAYLLATEGTDFYRYSLDTSTGAITSAQPVVTSLSAATSVSAMRLQAITVP